MKKMNYRKLFLTISSVVALAFGCFCLICNNDWKISIIIASISFGCTFLGLFHIRKLLIIAALHQEYEKLEYRRDDIIFNKIPQNVASIANGSEDRTPIIKEMIRQVKFDCTFLLENNKEDIDKLCPALYLAITQIEKEMTLLLREEFFDKKISLPIVPKL